MIEVIETKLANKNQNSLNKVSDFILLELNYCEKNPDTCQNGAKCVSLIKEDGNYRCLCREGTSGRNCEISEYSTMRVPFLNSTTTLKTPTKSTTYKTTIPISSSTETIKPVENKTHQTTEHEINSENTHENEA